MAPLAAAPRPDAVDPSRLRDLILLRCACLPHATGIAEMARDASRLGLQRATLAEWRGRIERETAALISAGLLQLDGRRATATPTGSARARAMLGSAPPPATWGELLAICIVARALALERSPAGHLEVLKRPDGLNAAIAQHGYRLTLAAKPTPARLRQALAAVAIERAFADQSGGEGSARPPVSAKAARLLAANLAGRSRDPGTDSRLIAMLAAACVGAARGDPDALRVALVRRWLTGVMPLRSVQDSRSAAGMQGSLSGAAGTGVAPRPDLARFVADVRAQAHVRAHGWPGNRRAYISHVWRSIRDRRPEWGLTEIEFKGMLAEAHRRGEVVLANADLKDDASLQDIRDSAVAYKNAVFHFVRVDD